MNSKINAYFVICLLLFSMFPVQAVAPTKYYEIDSDVALRGAIFTDVDPSSFYASLVDGVIQIDSSVHYTNISMKLKGTALNSRLKKYNGFNIGYTHIADDGTTTNEIKPLEIDFQGFAYLTCDFSTVIINGMTGTTTTTLTGLSGNQSISVPNGSGYDLNITNNQEGNWASTDGRNYQNKSIITINGSMVTTELGIPLQLFTNLEGVNGSGDIGIAYTNLTAIPREIEAVWDSDNVSLYYSFNTTSGVDNEFVVLWGSGNNTEPDADSTYGSEAVWDANYKGVWHMNQDPTGDVANSIKDSTSNANHGTPVGSMTSADLVDAPYGKGIDLDGGNDYIACNGVITDTDLTQSGLVMMELYMDKTYETNVVNTGFGVDGSFANYLALYFDDDMPNCGCQMKGGGGTYISVDHASDKSGLHIHTLVKDGKNLYYYVDGSLLASDTTESLSANIVVSSFDIGMKYSTLYCMKAKAYEVRITSGSIRCSGYISTTHKNLNNPTAFGADQFYLSVGETQTASVTVNITASVTGDNNTQSYNTSQSRDFTLTPNGTTNNVFINTTSTDYDVTVTTYWTENTTLQSETATAGYAKQYINYTPSFNVTSADINTTFAFDFSAQDYIGTATSTLNDVSKTTIRDGQDINASVGSLTESVPYWWNVTVPYNNVPTVGTITNQTAYLGISESFTAPSYSDPEGLPIDTHYWQFGDSNTSSDQNPTNTYTSIDTFSANYTVTETATVSPQAVLREFTVDVEVQPPQNVTTVPHQTNVSIDWDDYAYADKYSVYELQDGFPYVDTNPTVDGVKDAIYDCAHKFLIFSPNPDSPGDYETSHPVRTALGAYFFHEAVDNDDKLGDDDLIYYFDLDNNGLNTNDYAWKITDNIVKRYHWDGASWKVSGGSSAVGASTGGGTHYPKHELFIPIAELGANWTNGSTVKVLVKREDSSLTPDVVTWYPYGNINNTDTILWQEMVLNYPDSYIWLANVTLSNYTALNLTPFTIYHGAVSAWNGTTESEYTLFDVITEDIPVYNVSGYVFDVVGDAIAGAVVYSCNGFVTEITSTDINGYWIGYAFREQNYTICANKSGYVDNSIDIYVSTNLTNQNITLTAFEMTDWMLWEKLLEIESQNEDIKDDINTLNSIIWVASLLAAIVVISVLRKKLEEYE